MIDSDLPLQVHAIKLSDAKRIAEEYWRQHEDYRETQRFNDQVKELNALAAQDFADQQLRYRALLPKHEERRRERAKLIEAARNMPPGAATAIRELVGEQVRVSVDVGRVERHGKYAFGENSEVLHLGSAEIRPGTRPSILDRLQRKFLALAPRSNAHPYDICFRYRATLHAQDVNALANDIADALAHSIHDATLSIHDPTRTAGHPLVDSELRTWFPLTPEQVRAVLVRILDTRHEDIHTYESDDSEPAIEALQRRPELLSKLTHDCAEVVVRNMAAALSRECISLPLVQDPPPPAPPNPDYRHAARELVAPEHHVNTERFWKTVPWESIVSILSGDDRFNHGRVLLGYNPATSDPVYATRRQLQSHVHILGSTQSRKTSTAVLPILIQLLRGSDEPADGPDAGRSPPILVLDLKGDFALYNTTRLEAQARGRPFHHFTNSPHHRSHFFDIWGSLATLHDHEQSLAELIAQALDLFHGPGYGTAYFSKLSREGLAQALERLRHNDAPRSMQGLKDALEELRAKKGPKGGLSLKDTDELYATLTPFAREPLASRLVVPPELDGFDPEVINMQRVIDNREVAYFWGPIDNTSIQDVCRLALFSFLHAAAVRTYMGERRQCYVIVDECQNIASYNMGRLLQFASSIGVSLILCNQSRGALKVGKVDIRDDVIANSNLKIDYTCATREDLEELVIMSGERIAILASESEGEGESEGTQRSTTSGWADTLGSAHTVSQAFGSVWGSFVSSNGSGSSSGGSATRGWADTSSSAETTSGSSTDGTSKGTSRDWRTTKTQLYRPALDANEILLISETLQACIVRTTQKDVEGGSDLGMRPLGIAALSPVDAREYEVRRKSPPPLFKPYEPVATAAPKPHETNPKYAAERERHAQKALYSSVSLSLAQKLRDFFDAHQGPPPAWPPNLPSE